MTSIFRNIIIPALLLFTCTIQAQQRSISGTVMDSDSIPLPGVSVVDINAGTGVITDLDGKYSIEINADEAVLEFRFVGMLTQTKVVGEQESINVVLQLDLYKVDEVVVTALGISKETKALGYSVTAVGSDELTQSSDKSMLTALQGKVAGVNITSASGAPGASTRIMVRGVSSLSGGNQPLFVIDGVPVNNGQSGSASINGGTDYGNKVNDINMDDIESVSMLKGASGTALYGSRAANGVIIITTKKGTLNTKAKVAYSASVGFEEPARLVEYQNEYGQGIYGNLVLYENMSWGPSFDSRMRPWGNIVDNKVRAKAYRALPQNVEEFFERGMSFTNSLSVSGGNEKTTYFFSYSNVNWDGIFPTDADSYNRNTFSMRGSQQVNDRLKITTSVNYIRKNNSSVPTGQGESSVYNQIMQTPRDIPLLELKEQDVEFNSVDNHYSLYTLNPYHILYNNGNENIEDRVYGSMDIAYNIVKGLDATWRLGADRSLENRKSFRSRVEPEGNNEFSAVFDPGGVSLGFSSIQQLNSDFILNWNKSIASWDFNVLAGHSLNERKANGFGTGVSFLTLPGYFNLSNTDQNPSSAESRSMVRTVGAYASADISFQNFLFLGATVRNEWSSTLPVENNSYLFPSVNTSFIFTELLHKGARKVLSFGKIRASVAKVGNGAAPYSYQQLFVSAGHSDGFGYFSYPTFNGVNAYELGNGLENLSLRPEMTTETELGLDIRLFNNRLSFDLAYYHGVTKDLIWASPKAYTSGFGYQTQNLGQMVNQGFEGLMTITPVKTAEFSWELSVNFTRNYNKLQELNTQLESAELNALRIDGGQQISWLAIPGKPIGVFKVRGPQYTDNGKLIVDNQGLPIADEELVEAGNSQYKYFGGVVNSFTYKGLSLSANVDFRMGGKMYSRTKDITLWAGTVPQTLYNDRQPFIIPNSVYELEKDEAGNPVYVENTLPIDDIRLADYWGNGGTEIDAASLIDKSFIKLRELTLSYQLPTNIANMLSLESLRLGVSGKNLYLWTPSGQTYIDPELTTFGNDLLADFGEYGAQPSVRSITFNIKVEF